MNIRRFERSPKSVRDAVIKSISFNAPARVDQREYQILQDPEVRGCCAERGIVPREIATETRVPQHFMWMVKVKGTPKSSGRYAQLASMHGPR